MKSRVLQLRASPATFHGLMDADRELAAGREPDLILAYLPADGTIAVTLSAMSEVWPASRRAGCEAVHQFADGEIATAGCLHFFWFDDPAHRVRVEVLQGTHDQPPEDSELETACAALAGCDAALFLADGLRFPVRALLAELRRHRASLPPVLAGALASRPAPYDAAGAAGARVFLDAAVHPSACLFIGFEGFTMDVEPVHEFRPASPIYTVTRAEGQTVYEIGGEPAVDWYRRFFLVDGQLLPMPQTAHSFPLLIDGPDPGRRYLCRALRAFDEPPGAVSYWGDVREGERVRLALGGDLSLVSAAARLARVRRGDSAAFLAAFSGRQSLRGDEAEAEELHKALGEVPLAGLFTFGEISPGDGGGLALQNQTALIALLAEKPS